MGCESGSRARYSTPVPRGLSGTVDLDGPVFITRFGGAGRPMVLLHGLGSSHAHWLTASRAFADRHRVQVPDLPGFGRSPLAGRDTSLEANARLLSRFVGEIREPVILVGNSMGALLGMLVAADRPGDIAGLVLVAPPAPRPWLTPMDRQTSLLYSAYLWPGIGEWTRWFWVRLQGPNGMVRNVFEACCSEPSGVPTEVAEAALALAHERFSHDDDVHAFLAAYRSAWRFLFGASHFDRLVRSISAPTLVVHGTHDRLVPAIFTSRLHRLRPDWTFATLDGIGHMPHVEDAHGFVRLVNAWLLDHMKPTSDERRRATGDSRG
jgi:pimeloyl-ACP methyl ester carboxylesterase